MPEPFDAAAEYSAGYAEDSWQDYNELSAAQQYAVTQAYLVRTQYLTQRDVERMYGRGQAGESFYPGADRKRMIELGKVINIRSTAGGDAGFLNRLHWVKGSHDVLNLTPAQLSELVPNVRIFKVVYDIDGAITEEVEFRFPSSTDANMLSSGTDTGFGLKAFTYKFIGSNPATVRNDIEGKLVLYFQNFGELLRERRNSSGGTPYKFLELFERATRIQDGTDIIDDNPEDSKATLNQTAGGQLTPTAAEYQSNAVSSNRCKEDITSPRVYKGPKAFEIRIEVGYGVPPSSTLYTNEQWTIIKEALENAKQQFFLTLIDHDFSFGQDGTFTLDLNYRARLAGMLETPSADLLRIDLAEADAADASTTLTWLDDAGLASVFTGTLPEIVTKLNYDMKQAKACCDTEKRDFIQRRLDRLEDSIRSSKYQTISKYLLRNKLMKNFPSNAHTLKHWANNAGLAGYTRMETGAGAETSIVVGELGEGSAIAIDNLSPTNEATDPNTNEQGDMSGLQIVGAAVVNLVTGVGTGGIDQALESTFDNIPDTRLAAWEKLTLPENQVIGGTGPSGNAGVDQFMPVNIPFFALGDLMDLIMRMATRESEFLTEEEGDRICMALGTLNIDGKVHYLADCPISWYSFRNFWYEKVIKPRRTTYPALQFLRDILRDLVFGAINSPYWTANGKRARNKFRLNQAFVDLAGIPIGTEDTVSKNPLRYSALTNGGGIGIDLDVLRPDSDIFQLPVLGNGGGIFQYLVVCVKGGGTEQFQRKNIYDDSGNLVDQNIVSRSEYNQEKLNIANFGFGEEKGMFISANFSKTDLPYRRESRYLEAGNSMYAQLSNVYDVEIKMFGNPFFYPGMYIFVNPFGLSKTQDLDLSIGRPDQAGTKLNDEQEEVQDYTTSSISNLMGLGGYFVVTEVTGEIVDSQYLVTVKATHDNTGSNFDVGAEHPGAEDKCPEEDE